MLTHTSCTGFSPGGLHKSHGHEVWAIARGSVPVVADSQTWRTQGQSQVIHMFGHTCTFRNFKLFKVLTTTHDGTMFTCSAVP